MSKVKKRKRQRREEREESYAIDFVFIVPFEQHQLGIQYSESESALCYHFSVSCPVISSISKALIILWSSPHTTHFYDGISFLSKYSSSFCIPSGNALTFHEYPNYWASYDFFL